MILLALDPSLTRCGHASFEAPPVRLEGLLTGSFSSDDPADFTRQLRGLIDAVAPGMIFAEEARKVILTYGKKQLLAGPNDGPMTTPNGDQLKLSEVQGAIRGLAEAKGIPLVLVPPKTWRAKVLGNGNLPRAEAKRAAKNHCRYLKIPVRNHDQAEAVCIGLWGATCSQEFRMAIYQSERTAR